MKYGVVTRTKKEYNKLMIYLENAGFKWFSGHRPTENGFLWDHYGEQTVIIVDRYKNNLVFDKHIHSFSNFLVDNFISEIDLSEMNPYFLLEDL